MKKQSKLLVLPLLICAFLGTAQEPPKVHEIATYQTQLMSEKLRLSEEQLEEVSSLNEKYAKKMLELREKPGGKLSKMKEIRETQQRKNAELKLVLTKPQFNTYEEELVPEIKRHMRSKMK